MFKLIKEYLDNIETGLRAALDEGLITPSYSWAMVVDKIDVACWATGYQYARSIEDDDWEWAVAYNAAREAWNSGMRPRTARSEHRRSGLRGKQTAAPYPPSR